MFSYKTSELLPFIYGLPWIKENSKNILRIPERASKNLSRAIQELGTHLSGGRIRFSIDANEFHFKARVQKFSQYNHFSKFGVAGVDVYIDGAYWETLYSPKQINSKINLINGKSHLIEIYLPLYANMDNFEIKCESQLKSAPVFRINRPIIYYGSSITQGACASRAGKDYQALISRKLNADYINLGLSGNGRGDIVLSHLISEIDASMVILDWGWNAIRDGIDFFRSRYTAFYEVIRRKHPNMPIIFVNLQSSVGELHDSAHHEMAEKFRQHIEDVYQTQKKAGDNFVWLWDARNKVGPQDGDLTVDGIHLNDTGFERYAEGIIDLVKKEKILNLD